MFEFQKDYVSIIVSLLLLNKIIGDYRTCTMSKSYHFGANDEKDGWILATAIYSTLGLAIWGPINETFRTKFVVGR
jgi:hypothetical protein